MTRRYAGRNTHTVCHTNPFMLMCCCEMMQISRFISLRGFMQKTG